MISSILVSTIQLGILALSIYMLVRLTDSVHDLNNYILDVRLAMNASEREKCVEPPSPTRTEEDEKTKELMSMVGTEEGDDDDEITFSEN